MRLTCLAFVLLLVLGTAYGQSKAKVTINYGYQWTSTYTKLFSAISCFEGCYPTLQKGAWFPDLNILYDQGLRKPRWSMQIGADVNQKGWYEEGLASSGGPIDHSYQTTMEYTYAGLLGGLTYQLARGKAWKFVVGQLLNPELYVYYNDNILRLFALSTRTSASLEWMVGQQTPIYFIVTPYFHTALYPYNKMRTYGSNYFPFGFGLNLGVGFNVKDQS